VYGNNSIELWLGNGKFLETFKKRQEEINFNAACHEQERNHTCNKILKTVIKIL
jgi:hypothetical protein